jgi:serine/threonine-protein kinase PpkA
MLRPCRHGDDVNRQPTLSGQNPALPDVHGFRLQRVLGYGGMSTVYLARQLSLEREVALKVMLPEALTDEISRRRFENEARTIARLDHPHIVGIFEVGRTRDGLPYYAMPYLARGHLGQRGPAANETEARAILHALLDALEYAHSRGVVHRDVKAENVLFDDSDRPLLADFGIALRRGYGTRVTTAGLAVGSTAYMPPEQARGHNVDGRADLYSVGVLGWELLMGALPYNAGDALSMALQHAQEPIPRLPPEHRHWQKFFDKALAKTPTARFDTARAMRAALDKVPDRSASHAAVRDGRLGRWLGWGAAAVVTLAAGAWLWHWQASMRAAPPASTSVSTAASSATAPTQPGVFAQAGDTLESFMRPLPESAAERWIADAEHQLQQQRWTTPRGDNAYESLMTAQQADNAHPRLVPTAATLVAALSSQAQRALQEDRTSAAEDAVKRARALAERIALPQRKGSDQAEAIARMEDGIDQALRARLDAAARDADPQLAQRTLAQARRLGVTDARLQRLTAAAGAVRADGPREVRSEAGWTVLRGGPGQVAIAEAPVSRADYTRFAQATDREGALCRDRGSLLRVLSPRDWKSPGFDQAPQHPVVCVSWQDAQAYAQWLGRRDGKRYRLARPAEANAAPPASTKPVATWSDACAETCSQRVAAGRGWRGGKADRALAGDRGYDDVGFRLARDL